MTDAIRSRGPDAGSQWRDDAAGVGLGHRRLSVIDLSEAGAQPMHSACGRYVLSFNGEIYNFQAIRRELDRHGRHDWRGHSDTEVLLAAIAAWGLRRALQSAAGMFAFALWDRGSRTLQLGRDRLGEKPLYFGWAGDAFVFASELKALTACREFQPVVDRDALTLLLRHGYIPAPYCIYRGVRKLLQGTTLTVTAADLARRSVGAPVAYWSLREAVERGQSEPFDGDDAAAVAELRRLLSEAVSGQMIADVPLGALLSGGIDSSAVVALMQAQSARPIKTFSIGFHEQGFDESAHAAAVARHLGTEHTELMVTPAQARDVIPRLPDIYDEPFADSSQIPTCLVSALARRHVTVALTGDGGDELFGGYNHYEMTKQIWRAVAWAPPVARQAGAAVIRAVPAPAWSAALSPFRRLLPHDPRKRDLGKRMRTLAEFSRLRTPDEVHRSLVSHWKSPADVVLDGSEPVTRFSDPDETPALSDIDHRMMYRDGVVYLADDILVKVDRAAMAVSLETRVPLLDHRVAEFAWRLPLRFKLRHGERKWLLRRLLFESVPRPLVERPKMGFGVPIDAWLRGPLREWAEPLLNPTRLAREGYFDARPVQAAWREHVSGRRDWSACLWDVLMFQAWLEARHSR